jgi:predicted RNase H-like HicB family nuclease
VKHWRVTFEPDEDGYKAQVHGLPDGTECVTWGHDMAEARKRVQVALGVALERDLTAEDVFDFEEDFL